MSPPTQHVLRLWILLFCSIIIIHILCRFSLPCYALPPRASCEE